MPILVPWGPLTRDKEHSASPEPEPEPPQESSKMATGQGLNEVGECVTFLASLALHVTKIGGEIMTSHDA